MLIGEILIKQGSIQKYQLDYALELQRKEINKKLGQLLMETELIDKGSLVNALAEQQATPGIDIINTEIENYALQTLTVQQAYKYNVLPFKFVRYRSGSILYIATSKPNDLTLIEDISFITRKPIKAFYALDTDIKTAITISYNKSRKIS